MMAFAMLFLIEHAQGFPPNVTNAVLLFPAHCDLHISVHLLHWSSALVFVDL
tara:strand:- start:761 stop:916 length:156 start_codon:yes stop_codon:yes gene_type:complete